ncbi:MAG: AAA family ATPase [Gemmatimonadetes bacterium]|nr:AAA family ATPase [Gemmatimonadota bacterium]
MLKFTDHGGRFEFTDERIECAETEFAYRLHQGQHTFDIQTEPKDQRTSSRPILSDSATIVSESLGLNMYRERTKPEESVLSQVRDAQTYPALHCLQEQYERIRLYRNWAFGPAAELRRNQSTHDPSDFLNEGGANLALVLSHFQGEDKRKLVAALQELFDGIVDVNCPVTGGTVSLFLEERDGRQIPVSRLSDGTLRYLCRLAILLHPEPPSLVAIEEPELGLHPDLLPTLSDLLVQASERSQLIVTTHSDVLVDALTDKPESIVVCEKHAGQTAMERLDKDELAKWLGEYSLGNLWTSGQLGGNRW